MGQRRRGCDHPMAITESYPPLLARIASSRSWLRHSRFRRPALAQPDVEVAAGEARLSVRRGDRAAPDRHPLGGCPMGDDATGGVVDDCGRVFDASGSGNSRYHDGLVVLDGSMVPASLGINPALTIASLALRAIAVLREDWGYTEERAGGSIGNRPCFKQPGPVEPAKDTLIEVIERLSGPVAISGMKHEGDAHVELTMRFDPVSIRDLVSGTDAATLQLQPGNGRLRIFAARPRDDREAADEDALLVASVAGTLGSSATRSHRP